MRQMRKRFLSVLLALCMALSLLPAAFAAAPGSGGAEEQGLHSSGGFFVSVEGVRAYAYAYQVAEQVNQLRASLGLSRLTIDRSLMNTAMLRAAECSVYYSHTRPNGTSCSTAFPSRWTSLAENIAAGYTTPAAVMSGWTNSPGHYANMTSTIVSAFGVGCFYVNGTYYWAQCFTGGGSYSSVSDRLSDETSVETFTVSKEYFSPVVGTGTVSLRVGESRQLPIYNRNLGFSSQRTPLRGVSGASLSGGANLVKLDSDRLTITAVAPGSGTVTLSLPGGDKVSFAVQVSKRFTDVPDWCDKEANWAAAEGVAKGVGDNRFAPSTPCTNAQILTFLWRAEGQPAARTPSPFLNVASDYQGAVDWAYEKGIIDKTFAPGASCTRSSAVSYIWKVFGSPNTSGESFLDVPPDASYAGAVAWAVANGVANGYGDTFRPDSICTRGHIVTFLYRAYVQSLSE